MSQGRRPITTATRLYGHFAHSTGPRRPMVLPVLATSLGSAEAPGPLPVDVSRVSGSALVADAVVVPERTPLLQAAQARGLPIVRGVDMLTAQIETIADFLGTTEAPHAAATNAAATR